MTTTYHPGGLQVTSEPDGDLVTFIMKDLGAYAFEKIVLRSIVAEHAKEIVMAALDIRLHDLEEGDLERVKGALDDLGIEFDVIGDPNR